MNKKYLHIPEDVVKEIEKHGFFVYNGLRITDFILVIFDHFLKKIFEYSLFAKAIFFSILCFIGLQFSDIFLFPLYFLSFFAAVGVFFFYGFIFELFSVIIYLTKCGEIVFLKGYFFYMGILYQQENIFKIPKKIIYDKDIPKIAYFKYIGYAKTEEQSFFLNEDGKQKYFTMIDSYLFSRKKYKVSELYSSFSEKYNILYEKQQRKIYEKIFKNFWKMVYFLFSIPILIMFFLFYIIGLIIFYIKNITSNVDAFYTPYIFGKIYKHIKILEIESQNFSEQIKTYKSIDKSIKKINSSIQNIIKGREKLLIISEYNEHIHSLLRVMIIEKLYSIFVKIHDIVEGNIKKLKEKQIDIQKLDNENMKLLEVKIGMLINNLQAQKEMIEEYQGKLPKS